MPKQSNMRKRSHPCNHKSFYTWGWSIFLYRVEILHKYIPTPRRHVLAHTSNWLQSFFRPCTLLLDCMWTRIFFITCRHLFQEALLIVHTDNICTCCGQHVSLHFFVDREFPSYNWIYLQTNMQQLNISSANPRKFR